MVKTSFLMVGCLLSLLLFFSGCATPGSTQLSETRIIDPSQEDNIGGSFLESGDIQTIASRMCPEILTIPEISNSPGVVRIAIAPVRNSTRYVIDKDILMKRLRLSLNEYSENQIRFFSQGSNVAPVRNTVLREQQTSDLEATLDSVANYVVNSSLVSGSPFPLKVMVVPPKNVNFVNMNADSFIALLRAKIAERSGGKVQFLSSLNGGIAVDYLLSGEFIAQSMKKEGVFTPFDNVNSSQNNSENKNSKVDVSVKQDGSVVVSSEKSESSMNSDVSENFNINDYKDNPNITKYLNIQLIDSKNNVSVLEKLFTIERKIEEGIGKADYILAGELSGLSKSAEGNRSDYVLVTFQLIEPNSNEIIWERGYETKRVSSVSTLYK